MKKKAPVIGFVGFSNSGKTTMLGRVIELLSAEGWRIGVLKHDVHGFEVDQPGKDSWRLRQAGARVSAILSGNRWAWMEERKEPIQISELVARMQSDTRLDLVFLEGFKTAPYPKVVFLKREEDAPLLHEVTAPLAVVSWFAFQHPVLPVFGPDEADGLKDFLLTRL